MDALDIGVGIGSGWGIEAMGGAVLLFDGAMKAGGQIMHGVAIELDAQVSGDDDFFGFEAVVFEMLQEAIHGPGGIGFGQFVAVGQELSATGQLPDGVLEAGQTVGPHLRPVEREIGQVFDIHLETGEGGISRFDRAQIVFSLVAAFARAGQLVLADDAVEGCAS